MSKLLFLVILLSANAQRLQYSSDNRSIRDGIEINYLDDVAEPQSELSYRLPNNTRPEIYFINLDFGDFHLDDLDFSGNALISIEILEDTNTITLHSSVELLETSLTMFNDIGSTWEEIEHRYELDLTREFLIITTAETLTRGNFVRINFTYHGTIGTEIKGFFRGSYLHNENERRYFVATHMQPTFFRRICPSYDEPQFKAFYTISVIYNPPYEFALSNSPAEFTKIEINNRTRTLFEQTSTIMPTYLIALAITDFESNSNTSSNGVKFTAYSRPEQIQNTEFALDTAIKALGLYENAFEIEYELEKLDQVALPVFNRGGMENYGIVFYHEDYMLYEPSVTTAFDKEFAAATIVHEICHKFFGNLLTPQWWSVVWLSEGFCRFYEYYMTEKIYPTMRMEELFAVEAAQNIMYRDSSLTTRPMTWYVESPSAVAGLFDGIAYSKSASVIRMFLYSLSEETFHKGLKIYLSKLTSNPQGVAVPEHLYDALQMAVDEDEALPENYKIAELFGSWEKQAGYPYVYVERSYNDYRIRFTQNRFTDDVVDGVVWDSLWHIPITYTSKANPTFETKPKFWMSQRQMEITLDDVKLNSYFMVNVQQTGYYRVQYDEANWMLIANELSQGDFSVFSPNSRAMLIDDAAVFFENKILKVRIFLELIKYLEHDIDYIPWLAATNNLVYIRRMLDDGSSRLSNDFKRFLRVLLERTFNAFGAEEVENEPHYHKHIRNIAINWACQAHLDSCISETRFKFNDVKEGTRIGFSNDHETALFCNGILKGGETEFNFMWNLYTNSFVATRRTFYLNSIGCIENEEILTRFIHSILESNDIDNSNEEWLTIVQATYANGPIGLRVALQFLREKYDPFIDLLVRLDRLSSLNSIFRGIANRINTETLSRQFRELLVIYEIDDATLNDVNETTTVNLAWLATYSDDIQEFLDDFFRIRSFSTTTTISYFMIIFGLGFNWIMQN